MVQIQRFCKYCGKKTLHGKKGVVGLGWGIFLTLVTLGFFVILWLPLAVLNILRPWRCQVCGKAKLA